MDRGRVGEDRESKETDGCPLTGDLSETEAEEMETAVVTVKTAVAAEAIETAVVQ
jgi:hypothetical protein